MNAKEKKFVDEYIFQFFNSNETDTKSLAVKAAKYAGYTDTEESTVERIVSDLMQQKPIRIEIDNQINSFREKLSGKQRRNLWKAIADFEIGTPAKGIDGRMPIRL